MHKRKSRRQLITRVIAIFLAGLMLLSVLGALLNLI